MLPETNTWPQKANLRPSSRVLASIFATLFVAYIYTHQTGFQTAIPVSRLDLLHALFVHNTFKIDAYSENTPDKAIYNGHYYCDKAPGTVLLALPSFSLAVGFLKLRGTHLDSESGWLISSWIASAGSLAIITALGGAAFFLWLCNWVQPRYAYLTTLALFLGAAPFPYSTLMMAHALTVGLLAVSLWAGKAGIDWLREAGSRLIDGRDILAGCCCGLALANEFSAGIAVGGILLLFMIENYKRACSLVVGMLPSFALIGAYNWICFASPVNFAYHHQAVFTQMHKGFFGISGLPSPDSALHLLFSLSQGLFVWSPVLLLASVGYFQLSRISKELFLIIYLAPVLQVMAISAYWDAEAGGTLGPRLLSPVLPLIALPTAFGIARFPRMGTLLAAVSIALTTFATVIDIVNCSDSSNPLVNYYLPTFRLQEFSPNLGSVLGLRGYLSLLPLLLIVSCGMCLTWRNLPAIQK